MRQVLFRIPVLDLPIYGYGAMLFLGILLCIWLAHRLGRREGIAAQSLTDLAIWIVLFGIVGARITFMIQYRHEFVNPIEEPLQWLLKFVQLWDGGLVFYGSAIGGVVGYFVAYAVFFKKQNVSTWKVADLVAPCAAIGLCFGRLGCLLNGCCYGNVACTDCPAIHFPLSATPTWTMVKRGYQTAAGFTVDSKQGTLVSAVEPESPAAQAGLQPGDKILMVDGNKVGTFGDLEYYMQKERPRGKNDLALSVERNETPVTLPAFSPWTIGVQPTQIYESISMALLLFFLLSYYPYKKYDGSVMVFFMYGYGMHRFLNEMLRTDTEKVAFDMTLSQNVSLIVLLAATVLAVAVWRRGPREQMQH